MNQDIRRATFTLPVTVLEALDEAVAQGAATSKSALVERALLEELARMNRQMLAREWEAASRDPLFIKDIDDVDDEFRAADAETARGLDSR